MNQVIDKNGKDEFAAAVAEGLTAAHPDKQTTYEPEAFCIRFEDTDFCLYLAELYKEYSLTPPAARPDLIRRIVVTSCRTPAQVPEDYADARCDLLPKLVRRSQVEANRLKAQLGQRNSPFTLLTEDFGVFVVFDFPECRMEVDSERMEGWRTSFPDMLEVCKENLRSLTREPMVRTDRGLYVSPWHDSYDSARLLLTDVLQSCQVRGQLVAMPASDNLLVVTGSKDVRGLSDMVTMTERAVDEPRFLSGIPLVFDGMDWKPFAVPDSHPVSRRLKTLRYTTWATNSAAQAALVGEVLLQGGEDRFVGRAFVRKGVPGSISLWTDRVDPILPVAEAVLFNRVVSPSEVEMLACTPWAEVCRIMGDRMKSLDIYPGWYSCRGFPSDEELSELSRYSFDMRAMAARPEV